MRLLLDTNAYSALAAGDGGIADRVRRAEEVLISVVVTGELLYGFERGSRRAANRRQLDNFLALPFVALVPVNLATANRFAHIMAGLRAKGKPIPTNDVWIAAHALETGAELVSRDRHFERVDGLYWSSF
jgi:tRNA(fMet)-specific endonuclease VapC